MDRASDYGSEGCRFESYRGHKNKLAAIDNQSVTAFVFLICTRFARILKKTGSIDILGGVKNRLIFVNEKP